MKEGTAHGQGVAQKTVGIIDQMLCGMGEKSQEIQGKKHGRQMLLAMTKVVFEMIAVVFEDIDGLIFYFPTGASDLR